MLRHTIALVHLHSPALEKQCIADLACYHLLLICTVCTPFVFGSFFPYCTVEGYSRFNRLSFVYRVSIFTNKILRIQKICCFCSSQSNGHLSTTHSLQSHTELAYSKEKWYRNNVVIKVKRCCELVVHIKDGWFSCFMEP